VWFSGEQVQSCAEDQSHTSRHGRGELKAGPQKLQEGRQASVGKALKQQDVSAVPTVHKEKTHSVNQDTSHPGFLLHPYLSLQCMPTLWHRSAMPQRHLLVVWPRIKGSPSLSLLTYPQLCRENLHCSPSHQNLHPSIKTHAFMTLRGRIPSCSKFRT